MVIIYGLDAGSETLLNDIKENEPDLTEIPEPALLNESIIIPIESKAEVVQPDTIGAAHGISNGATDNREKLIQVL